ncbi:MAG TPA: pre-toxin TG domain-containing protein, partial [Polyangium sp.]|nr:pre-toxin TG domain-containing protein [Polyangium sp.]
KAMYGAMAEELKDRLNVWEANQAALEANLFFDTLRAFSAGMQEVEDGAQRGAEVMRTFVHAATRVGIGFVPFVGPALDLCEAVTGREWCTPSGRELTTGERVWSGIGFGAGKLVKVWKGVSKAAISAEGKAAAAVIYTMSSELVEKIGKARIQKWKTLTRGSILPDTVEKLDNDWEAKVVLALIEKKQDKVLAMGDGVKNVLGIVKDAKGNWGKSADVLTVSSNGGLIITEAKFPRAPLPTTGRPGGVDCYGAVQQLEASMEKAVEKGVAQDVELVQLAIPKDAPLAVKTLEENGIKTQLRYTRGDNGYLLREGQRIPLPGKPGFFVKLLELEQP